jgi:hypothetical protein
MKKLPLIISAVIILSLTAYIFQLKAQINNQSSAKSDQYLHAECSAEAERLKTEIDTWMTTAKQNADEASRNALIAQHSKKEAEEQRALAIENERKAVENEMKARAMMKAAEEQMKLAMQNEKMAQQTIAQLQEKLKNRN